ncbi:hypothetical protein CC78DRAFT_282028 [Lojkania enalia]|uniref:Ankyrin repeat protein n=1 Tax=Lojkania enalia TaxID=147567 RepID=A0A9P4TQ95_9PLEO|nr:hypothetical protein CC78DRAFT_282028 [Didymosphaeria enalia]
MADKHLDDDLDGDYEEYYSDDLDEYDDGLETDAEVFEFNEVSEYVTQMDPIDGKEKHQEIITEAAERDLDNPEVRQQFLQEFRPYFKQKGTENFSILHSLARDMYDKSDGKKRNDYQAYIPLLDLLLEDLPDLPTQVDAQQRTALHMVAEAHQSEVVKYLVDNVPSDPDWIDKQRKDGETVLHICLRDGLPCAEHLIRKIAAKGQDQANKILSIQGENGDTPLHIAVQYKKCHGKQAELVQLLLDVSDTALGKENRYGLSPVRYHQESQRTFRAQLSQAPRITRSKPSPPSSEASAQDAKTATRTLRPRAKAPADKDGTNKKQLSSRPAAIRKRQPSEQPAQQIEKVDPEVAKTIQDLLLKQCLRTRSREEAIRILHGAVQRRQLDFDLVPLRKHTISADVLERYAGHLYFEPVLQYVAIPKLEVENFPVSKWKHEPFWDSKGRKDYVAIFDWLYEKGVRHIVRVLVVDHDERPHSDAVIIRSLQKFGVESLDWKRFDLCSHCIFNAVGGVRHLKLYCNGNDAILRSWSSPSGLVNLKQLQKLEVEVHLVRISIFYLLRMYDVGVAL